jgi:hypothetical protein
MNPDGELCKTRMPCGQGAQSVFIGTYSTLRMQCMQGGATRAARTLHLCDGGSGWRGVA